MRDRIRSLVVPSGARETRRLVASIGVWLLVWRVALQAVASIATADHDIAFLDVWVNWDAFHYLRIADVGYRLGGEDTFMIVFLPLYPALVAVVRLVVRDLVVSALLVSYASSVAAAYFLYQHVVADARREDAARSVVLLFAFPTAYFLAAPYSEALFLAAALGAFLAARRDRWGLAALAAAAATATRLVGIAVLPALALQAVVSGREGIARRLAWTAAGGAGTLAYLLVNLRVHGDPFAFLEIQRSHWSQHAVPFWTPLVDAAGWLLRGGLSTNYVIIYAGRLSAFALAAGLLLAGVQRLRATDQVYGWTALILATSAAWLLSLPRYVLAVYPIFVVAAWALRRRLALWTVVALSFALQAWLFARYAQALWTF